MQHLKEDIAVAEIYEKPRSVITIKSKKHLLDETNLTPPRISSGELREGEIEKRDKNWAAFYKRTYYL